MIIQSKNKFTRLFAIACFFLLIESKNSGAVVFHMAPLEFSNRAACADLSTKPARSIFLQLDAFNAGKAGYTQGLLAQRNSSSESPQAWAQKSVKNFRLWTSHLAVTIMEGLLQGKLPLLKPDGSGPAIFNEAVEKCLNKKEFLSCPAMNDLLSEIWARSKMKKPQWEGLGLDGRSFFPTPLREHATVGCHLIRKFSSFYSPLATQQIEEGTTTNIGIDSFKPENHLDSCFSTATSTDPRFSTLQLDLANLDVDLNSSSSHRSEWDQVGFQFWHSFKLFLSWGWRYAPEYQQEFGALRQVFSSIAFEDSVMILPNGCRSVEEPKCDSTGLSSDTMRAAHFLGMLHPAIGEVPAKPIDSLFAGAAEPVNADGAGLLKSENAAAWSRDFKEKLSGIRFEMLHKLNTSLTKLQIMTALISVKELAQDLQILLIHPESDPNYDPTETYLACMEYTLAKNDLFEDIYSEVQTLKQTSDLQSVLLKDSGKDLEKYVNFYRDLSQVMTPFCKTLEQKRLLLAKSNPNLYQALNEWAYDLTRPNERNKYTRLCATDPKNPSCPNNLDKHFLVAHPKQAPDSEVTVCKTSLECARNVLQSLVSIVSVRRYAHAFLPLDEVIQSPALFNNYAAPTACRLYDPWSKERNAWKLFVADLGSAVLSGASCGALNFRVLDLPTKKIVGYREIIDQNQSSYQLITKDASLKYLASVDFSFLAGLSCGVMVGNSIVQGLSGPNFDFFAQVVVTTCNGSSSTEYTVDRKGQLLLPGFSNPVETNENTTQVCFSCAVGFKTLAQMSCAASPMAGQIVVTSIGLFQGVLRLVTNLSDPDNIVRSDVLNIDQIAESYKATHGITPSCHDHLKEGVTCHEKVKGGKP